MEAFDIIFVYLFILKETINCDIWKKRVEILESKETKSSARKAPAIKKRRKKSKRMIIFITVERWYYRHNLTLVLVRSWFHNYFVVEDWYSKLVNNLVLIHFIVFPDFSVTTATLLMP